MQLESVWVLLKPTLNMFFTVFDKLGMTTPLTPWPQEKQSQYWQQYIGHNSARAFYKLVKWWRWRTRAGCRCSSNTRRPDVWAREQTTVFSRRCVCSQMMSCAVQTGLFTVTVIRQWCRFNDWSSCCSLLKVQKSGVATYTSLGMKRGHGQYCSVTHSVTVKVKQ